MISVLILTRNEQHDLPGCLASVSWSDDIHVFDSRSTDNTVEIAQRRRRPHPHPRLRRLRHAPQRRSHNHPLQTPLGLPPRRRRAAHARTLPRDAATRPRRPARNRRLPRPSPRLPLRHLAQTRPDIALLHPPRPSRAQPAIPAPSTRSSRSKASSPTSATPLDHYPFSKGIAHWVTKHNQYSSMEAELIARNQGLQNPSLLTALRHPDFHTRRLHQKAIFYRLPGRPCSSGFTWSSSAEPSSTAPPA